MIEDDIFLSVTQPKQAKAKKREIREIAKQAYIDSKPDYSQSDLPPIEIKKVRFDHKAIDYSRDKQNLTEDEIFDLVMNPEKKVQRTNTQDSPEVTKYFESVIQQSLVRRGRAFSKI